MKRKIYYIIILLNIGFIICPAEFKIASGAGYKKPVMKLIKIYESENPETKINPVFGNLEMIISQSNQTGDIAFLIGDLTYFKTSNLDYNKIVPLGKGILVLAYSKQAKITDAKDILQPGIKSIGIPDTDHAMYGIAGSQYLKNNRFLKKVEKKLIEVKTVPQVIAYLTTGEIDAGFINLTGAIMMKDKLGGWIELDNSKYEEINIVCAVIKSFENNKDVNDFLEFFQTQKAKAVLKEYGL